ncbi:hypothetical protein F5H01DRAFT_155953 [Linnemannia elongata]|nr:hypothetical protein F5H01DRAFT_155953 [Linnemannia elongata]
MVNSRTGFSSGYWLIRLTLLFSQLTSILGRATYQDRSSYSHFLPLRVRIGDLMATKATRTTAGKMKDSDEGGPKEPGERRRQYQGDERYWSAGVYSHTPPPAFVIFDPWIYNFSRDESQLHGAENGE